MYCNIVIGTSVGAIANVKCVFVFHLKIQRNYVDSSINHVYNDYRQLFDFSLRKKRSTEDNKDKVQGNRQGSMHKL